MTGTAGTTRFHSLDALRAGALLLGVFLHAAMSFLPQVTWMVKDNNESWQLLVGVFTIHVFRMSLFFAIAGFFARMLLEKRGTRAFLRNRTIRIAVPLVVFLPLLFAVMAAVALWAAAYADSGPFATPANAPAEPSAEAAGAAQSQGGVISFILFRVPLVHLWFLSVLLWMYAGALLFASSSKLIDRGHRIATALGRLSQARGVAHVLPIVLALPLAAVFLFYQPWTSTGGIPAPEGGLIPNLQSAVGYGTAFAFGWFLHWQSGLLASWRRHWPVYAVAAVLLTFVCARVMGTAADDPTAFPTQSSVAALIALAYPLATWAWCFALIGIATRFLSEESGTIRYLSDSSYWIYLVHMPIVGAFQVLVAPWSIGWPMKYLLILGVSIPILLASYQWLVRNSWIGGWLNGRRYSQR